MNLYNTEGTNVNGHILLNEDFNNTVYHPDFCK